MIKRIEQVALVDRERQLSGVTASERVGVIFNPVDLCIRDNLCNLLILEQCGHSIRLSLEMATDLRDLLSEALI